MIKSIFAASLALLAASCGPAIAQPLTSPNQDATSTTTKVPHPGTTKKPHEMRQAGKPQDTAPPSGGVDSGSSNGMTGNNGGDGTASSGQK